MQAEIIAIGDEILIGQTIDTNSTFIASQLNAAGIRVIHKRAVSDDHHSIIQALDSIFPETQLVFMTGGLGPTKDDITKKVLNEYFEGKLVYREEVYEHIKRLFAALGRVPSEVNRNQAYLPDCCTPVKNSIGTASGMLFKKNKVWYFSMPGVPYETELMMEKEIIPLIRNEFKTGNVVHRTILTLGVPESDLAERLGDWENNLPADLRLAYLPSPGMVKLRLSSYIDGREKAVARIKEELEKARFILGDVVYGSEEQTIQEVLGALLRLEGLTISTAESCTGGYVAHLITSIAGSSGYFEGGAVTYSNELKSRVLGVAEKLISKYGAVSREVVEAMAEGARERFHTDFAIATSGVAGPAGDNEEKPVGTIWIAVAGPQRVKSKVFRFGRHRLRNIRQSALTALDMARREVQKNKI